MKLFQQLLLTLTLIATSANAALDPYNLPTEVPTDLQEKLAWGLIKRDLQVIDEALTAGADAYTAADVIANKPFPDSETKVSPYQAITYKSKDIFKADNNPADMLAEMDDFSRCAEFLIKKGIDVDAGAFQTDFWGDELTFRNAYMRDVSNGKFGDNLPEHVEQYGKEMVLRIQKLIAECQPMAEQIQPHVKTILEELPHLAAQEAPITPKEKLEWGLYHLNKQAIEEALDAGANLEKFNGTAAYGFPLANMNPGSEFDILSERIKNAIEVSESQNTPPMVNIHDITKLAQIIRKYYEICEIMIIKGVSVDTNIGWPFGTMRDVVANALTQDAQDAPMCEPEYKRELYAYFIIMFKNLQTLIDKYQPEAKA